MGLRFTAAHSSRITKSTSPSKSPLLRRSSASPLTRKKSASDSPTRATLRRANTTDATVEDPYAEPLEDHGLIKSLTEDLRFCDVAHQIQHVRAKMFEAIPHRSGMNSTKTAEVLNYQRDLPPIVTVAHILSMSQSPTTTEREIAELIRKGIVRRISVPLRGVGSDAIGEGLVLVEAWISLVNESGLDSAVKQKYIDVLRSNPTATTVTASTLLPPESQALVQAGFLTSGAIIATEPSRALGPSMSIGALRYVSTAGSRAAAGSMAAVGGESAIYDAGGGGSGMTTSVGASYAFSLPNFGPYLKLLAAARQYLITLVTKTRYKELPLSLLEERWDAGSASTDKRGTGKGLEGAILPARTKKWKQFYGLSFKWVVQECAGSGAIELFDTSSVGVGVRLNT